MIGIVDSGIGGLVVAKAITEHLPGYDVVYFGDTARRPYGNKSPEIVAEYALEGIHMLFKRGARLVIVAPDAAANVAIDKATDRFQIPIFECVTPAVELSIDILKDKKTRKLNIGVIGTWTAIESGVYARKTESLGSGANVYAAACPMIVHLLEAGWQKKPETTMIIKKYLYPLKVRQIDALILGCAHYSLVKSIIQRKIGKRVPIIDASEAVVEKLKAFLNSSPEFENKLSKSGIAEFYVSDVTQRFETVAKAILKRDVHLKLLRP